MPIEYRVDHQARCVLANGRGAITVEEIFAYQREAWSRADVQGYDELVDMTDVQEIVEPTAHNMRALARLAAGMDPPAGGSRFAIVAPQALVYGLGRMYEAFREMTPGGTKVVSVFRDRAAAAAWLAGSVPETRASDSGPYGPGR